MSRLQAQLIRLYHPRPQPGTDTAPLTPESLVDEHGRTRALVLELAAPADWPTVARAWEGVQADLQLPAPALAVNGRDGYQLWFSLAAPVDQAVARAFLDLVASRYWRDLPQATVRIRTWPATATAPAHTPAPMPSIPRHAQPVPAPQPGCAQWSAFVSRELAPVFADTPWLDIPPNPDGQADLLSTLRSIGQQELLAALALAQKPADKASEPLASEPMPATSRPTEPSTPENDPRAFLMSIMNDREVALALRIEAAKALLLARGA